MTINFLYISLTWYCFVLTFVYSFIRRFTVRSCAIDRRKSDWIHRTGLSKPNYTRRFGTVNKAPLILLDSFDFDRIRHRIKFRVLTESNVDFYHFFILRSNHGWSEEEVLQIMLSLQSRGIIKSMAFNSFTRIHHEDTEIKVNFCLNGKKIFIKICSSERLMSVVSLGRQANANNCFKQATNDCHHNSSVLWKIGRWRYVGK